MSKGELFRRLNRRAAQLSPGVSREILKALDRLRNAFTEAEIARAIEQGTLDTLFSEQLMDTAFAPVREEIQGLVRDHVKYFARDIPGNTVGITFDVLSPTTVQAVARLDTKVMTTLKADVRETLRQATLNGLQRGVHPRETARTVRSAIGLAPNQEQAVENFIQALREGKVGKALGYELRDKRFDRTLMRMKDTPLSAEQIAKMGDHYRRNFVAWNAATNARTATLDAMKLGQRIAYQEAIDKGLIDPSRLIRRWETVGDSRVRDEHVAMEGKEAPWDGPFDNGELIPGESTFNCRCVARHVLLRRAA